MVFLAEHSWTISLIVAPAAILCVLIGLQQQSARWLGGAGALFAALGVTIICASVTETPADCARAVIERLVEAAVAGDPARAKACFAIDATIHMGSPEQPGSDRGRIDRAFESFATRHRIESNEVSYLSAESITADSARVELRCRTRTLSSMGTVPTRWQFEVARTAGRTWLITRITWIAVGNQKPNLSLL